MARAHLILALLAGSISTAWAQEPAPLQLGNLKAELHQTCGKGIIIQLSKAQGADEGHMILGLRNNQTDEVDLFMSVNETDMQYDKYQLVRFDNLSTAFIAMEDGRPDIVWGGALSSVKGMQYSLALGSHVYACGKPARFEREIANDLYGEKSDTAS